MTPSPPHRLGIAGVDLGRAVREACGLIEISNYGKFEITGPGAADWLSKIMANLGGRPGISALLVDNAGIVLAAPPDQASMIGQPLDNVPLLSAITYKALSSNSETGSISFAATDGSRRTISSSR